MVVGCEELDWMINELWNGLCSIEWDLEDLEEIIDILGVGGWYGRVYCGDRGCWELVFGGGLIFGRC